MKVSRIFLLILFIAAGNAMIIASSASVKSGSKTKVHTVEDVKNGLDCEIFAYIIDSKYQDIQLVIQNGIGTVSVDFGKTRVTLPEKTLNGICDYINTFYISKTKPVILKKEKTRGGAPGGSNIFIFGKYRNKTIYDWKYFKKYQDGYLVTLDPEFIEFAGYIKGIVYHYIEKKEKIK